MKKSDLPPLPSDADLRQLIHFSTGDGRIWLSDQRMLLIHARALGYFRKELIANIGKDQARRLLLRAGYASGEQDAALARQVRKDMNVFDMFAVGPQLHMLEGAVQVTPEVFELDIQRGHFHGRFRWEHSWEAETHVRDFGVQAEPVCWMLLGYASGYTSGFMGKMVLFKEVMCSGCGDPHCLIEGRPISDWPDGEALKRDYDAESLFVRLADLQSEVTTLRSSLTQNEDEFTHLVGRSSGFEQSLALLRKAASTQVTVLLTGETGVGKERFARALHQMSLRADKPFVAINCAALPADLIESELFGAEKGAYTGADSARAGRFERADGGTLLLDELGELPLPAQAKLLRVLQQGEIERLGGSQIRKVDVRVIAATNVDLEQAVKEGRFRADLMYRLNIYPIRIPPLRERIADIEPLAQHALKHFSTLHQKTVSGFTDRALDLMRHYAWPGNVRELENLIERGVILVNAGEAIDAQILFPTLPESSHATLNPTGNLTEHASHTALIKNLVKQVFDHQSQAFSLDQLERAVLEEAVKKSKGNLAAAARSIGLSRAQLSYRLQALQNTARAGRRDEAQEATGADHA